MLTDAQQRNAAKKFAAEWEGRGYEKGETHAFWMELLQTVCGVVNPAQFITFESQVVLGHTSFIDAGIGILLILTVITFFTVSCSNISSEEKKLPTRNILSHIENSGYPEAATLISATTETFFINGKKFKINYKINVLGNGNKLFTNRELALRVLLETSLFQETNGKFSEVNFSNAVGELSVKIVQPGPGQELSTSVRPSSILNWNKDTGVPDIYIVNYRIDKISVKWEDSIHSDGYLYGFVCFEMKSKNSRILSGTEKRNIDKYLEPVKFDVKIRKR